MVSTRKSGLKNSKPVPKAAKAPAHKKPSEKKTAKAIKKTKEKVANKENVKKAKDAPKAKAKKDTPKAVPVKVKPAKADKVKVPEKKPQNKPKKPAGTSYLGYTPDQYKKFVELKEKLDEKTNNDLKEICRNNGQKVTGTKSELVERIADGKILGAIPKCPSCGGGRPKWDAKTATYKCPGYMEDSDFINCNKKFIASDIQRSPWQD
ncbi:hypothetical protein SteCoe_10542 [Stentor coeruleus]|uniref:SAP domain-containing protein n=1 Tax=Stentor coeruleus TaxID=5963 RepID=A0A1R2CF99_9CILI|nr:hypothetical protein SteCoe_10542 [Stentor coeruleus]